MNNAWDFGLRLLLIYVGGVFFWLLLCLILGGGWRALFTGDRCDEVEPAREDRVSGEPAARAGILSAIRSILWACLYSNVPLLSFLVAFILVFLYVLIGEKTGAVRFH